MHPRFQIYPISQPREREMRMKPTFCRVADARQLMIHCFHQPRDSLRALFYPHPQDSRPVHIRKRADTANLHRKGTLRHSDSLKCRANVIDCVLADIAEELQREMEIAAPRPRRAPAARLHRRPEQRLNRG